MFIDFYYKISNIKYNLEKINNFCNQKTDYEAFLKEFEEKNKDYEIIELLPVENTSKVNFKYPTIYSTDIRQMAGIIENVDFFITADCGVMHLACATNTTTIGLFKFTNINKYKPYGNKNFGIHTQNLSPEEVYKQLVKQVVF